MRLQCKRLLTITYQHFETLQCAKFEGVQVLSKLHSSPVYLRHILQKQNPVLLSNWNADNINPQYLKPATNKTNITSFP